MTFDSILFFGVLDLLIKLIPGVSYLSVLINFKLLLLLFCPVELLGRFNGDKGTTLVIIDVIEGAPKLLTTTDWLSISLLSVLLVD